MLKKKKLKKKNRYINTKNNGKNIVKHIQILKKITKEIIFTGGKLQSCEQFTPTIKNYLLGAASP